MIKHLLLIQLFLFCFLFASSQTLQTVTDNGATTTRSISALSYVAEGGSFAGSSTPTNISLLSGLRINGNIGNTSHNGITYQSGGGGGAAIGFHRGGAYQTGIDFYTNSTNAYGNLIHRMRISYDGNVGIGTISPTEKLSVKGKIRAQEIKVEAPGIAWPDYVFKQDYQLIPLSEIEAFIKVHHHLPDIPSVKEVEESGVSLGEMNAKLLKKIEELTLHLIEQDKQLEMHSRKLEEQGQIIRYQQKEIQSLKRN